MFSIFILAVSAFADTCMKEDYIGCSKDNECCAGLVCGDFDAITKCAKPAVVEAPAAEECMPIGIIGCSDEQPCCDGLTCYPDSDAGPRCIQKPAVVEATAAEDDQCETEGFVGCGWGAKGGNCCAGLVCGVFQHFQGITKCVLPGTKTPDGRPDDTCIPLGKTGCSSTDRICCHDNHLCDHDKCTPLVEVEELWQLV